jgi:hypothetical protein
VLDDLAAFQAKDVHHRLSARIIGQAVPMTVKDHVVAVGKDTLDLAMSIRMVRPDPVGDFFTPSTPSSMSGLCWR